MKNELKVATISERSIELKQTKLPVELHRPLQEVASAINDITWEVTQAQKIAAQECAHQYRVTAGANEGLRLVSVLGGAISSIEEYTSNAAVRTLKPRKHLLKTVDDLLEGFRDYMKKGKKLFEPGEKLRQVKGKLEPIISREEAQALT